MRWLVVATVAALLGVFILAAAFAHTTAPSRPATALAGPPTGPCVFPDAAELTALAGASDLVVNGTVEGKAQVVQYAGISQPLTRYVLRVRSVLRGSTSSPVLTIEEAGGVPVPIMQPGPLIAFLTRADRTDGLTTYFLSNGLAGAFLLRPAGVTRECAHFQAASTFVNGAQSEAAFSDQVRGLTPSAAPHKQRPEDAEAALGYTNKLISNDPRNGWCPQPYKL